MTSDEYGWHQGSRPGKALSSLKGKEDDRTVGHGDYLNLSPVIRSICGDGQRAAVPGLSRWGNELCPTLATP